MSYIKAYINKNIRKNKLSVEYQEAAYHCYKKMKGMLSEKKQTCSGSEKDMWDKACREIESWGSCPLQIDIAKLSRKTLSKTRREKYRCLFTIRS